MAYFELNSNRKKLILTIFLSLFLMKASQPVLGKDTPLSPNLSRIVKDVKDYSAGIELKLPTLSFKRFLARIPSNTDSNEMLPTLIPTRPFAFVPTPTSISAQPTITPVHLPQTVPTVPSNQTLGPEDLGDDLPTTHSPRPTRTARPTKAPTPIPFKMSNPRPGQNFQDAANIVGEVMCVPPAMIMATLKIEYGPWMGDVEANWVARNTYGGSDPHDKSGSTAIPSGVVVQMMEDTWHRIKPYVGEKLGSNELSLAVTFDAIAAGAYHLRNISLAGQDKVSCSDWPVKYILYGACRYNGACAAGSHTYNDYSYTVCNNYNLYTTGPKKNCR